MPKERLHILLADESLKRMESSGYLPPMDEQSKFAFLLGSIFPDVLFYDLPAFDLSPLGGGLHRYEGEAGAAFFKAWLQEEGARIPSDFRAWMMGFVSHLLTDGLWHPRIRAFSNPPSPICRVHRLSGRHCHHWLESELEAYWLAVLGPPDAYIPLLGRFRKETNLTGRCAGYFRKFLVRAQSEGVPDEARIRRCLFWQVLLLRQFAHNGWANWKSWLLGKRRTNSLGALIVPIRAMLSETPASPLETYQDAAGLFDPEFMAEAVSLLSSRLIELQVRS